MKKEVHSHIIGEDDKQASSRKEDHIDLAFKSAVASGMRDQRFFYEPMINAHADENTDVSTEFIGKKLNLPIWVSSMTGGTEKAKIINENLARLCGEYGLGMGLGSCRQLLYDDKRMSEFDIRHLMKDQPFFINLGIAQVEILLENGESSRIDDLISRLDADGLIIHVNPLQEWLQPEGDRFKNSPISTVEKLLGKAKYPIVVKEVGQGFGKNSLELLLKLPLAAIDLAGFGGTNFSKLELLRSDDIRYESYKDIFNIGHTCVEMLDWINDFHSGNAQSIECNKIIISGGIKNFLDGYYCMQKSKLPSFYGQASGFLKYALNYDDLEKHLKFQAEGLRMANACLRIKE